MRKEIFQNASTLLSNTNLNPNPLCTYTLPVLTIDDFREQNASNYFGVNSFSNFIQTYLKQSAYWNRCLRSTGDLIYGTCFDLSIYAGSLAETTCSWTGYNLECHMIQLSYDSTKPNSTSASVIPTTTDAYRMGQLPIFYYPSLSATAAPILGVAFLHVKETWRNNGIVSYVEKDKLVLLSWKRSNATQLNTYLAVSAIDVSHLNTGGYTSNNYVESITFSFRVLYTWWANSNSVQNMNNSINFWTNSSGGGYNLSFNVYIAYSMDLVGSIYSFGNKTIYTGYTKPWDTSSTVSLRVFYGIYIGDEDSMTDFYEQ